VTHAAISGQDVMGSIGQIITHSGVSGKDVMSSIGQIISHSSDHSGKAGSHSASCILLFQ